VFHPWLKKSWRNGGVICLVLVVYTGKQAIFAGRLWGGGHLDKLEDSLQ